ncbi:unnamed protein product [Acanthoscelides obtectus]|uniref:Uncharacterized protein n=1 Tax=Acanthoscelides obtectus TaxID=200917 RepID=A0A9P0PTS6_ACAOB|nr:unnamed protein product [Acanthoscelides obtectus]CAK1638422.1 hypothetical protein AOBTE_LOCUS10595 [Acanthoscelides obtectus]
MNTCEKSIYTDAYYPFPNGAIYLLDSFTRMYIEVVNISGFGIASLPQLDSPFYQFHGKILF